MSIPLGVRRIPAVAGRAGVLPKGPNGRNLCRWCGSEVAKAKQTFCGPACVHEWKLRTQPSYQARHVLERDLGVCEACGLDCVALLQELRRLRKASGPVFEQRCDEVRLSPHLRELMRRLWEMDHRMPVAEGGGACGIENLRTLCWSCHRTATRELTARRREARQREKGEP